MVIKTPICSSMTKTKDIMASIPSLAFTVLVISIIALLNAHINGAEEYFVGDDEGWTNGYNYFTWSKKYNFTVGDVLVFKYVKDQHDVYRVTEEAFRSCNKNVGVLGSYASGQDRVNLTEAKDYWFMCSFKGHCKGGMRFGISVAAGSAIPAPPPTTETGFESPPVPAMTPGNGAVAVGGLGRRNGWLSGVVIALGLLFFV